MSLESLRPPPYISAGVGAKTASTPTELQSSISLSKVLGYLSKSSDGPNWIGFTKTETTTLSQVSFAFFIKLKCPSCKAPIVGTSPTFKPFHSALFSLNSLIVCTNILSLFYQNVLMTIHLTVLIIPL